MRPRISDGWPSNLPDTLLKQASRGLRAMRILSSHPSLIRRREYLFLLSHVRGYTTLIGHILGSHQEISGYAETWSSYRASVDLLKLGLFVCNHGNYKPASKYLFDKLLHNRLTIADSILERPEVRCVIMVREPIATLKSMVALYHKYIAEGGAVVGCTLPATVEDALTQYRERLRTLVMVGERLNALGRKFLFIMADDLLQDSHRVLRDLTLFLQLGTPLRESYSLFDRTGSWDRGDTSDFILRQQIVRERPQHDHILVPPVIAEPARKEYDRCLTRLRQSSFIALNLLLLYVANAADAAIGVFSVT
jgi:hypothetical protein